MAYLFHARPSEAQTKGQWWQRRIRWRDSPALSRVFYMLENEPTRRVTLKTLDDVKRELARVYREARNGKIETQDLGRFSNCLAILARIVEGSDLENRLAKLEEVKS